MAETGKIHIYYGCGKGKTTAAAGLSVRAAGSGLRVLIFQFLKDNTSSERKILESISNITCVSGWNHMKFSSQMSITEKMELTCYNEKILDEIEKSCASFDVLFLDEVLCAVKLGLLSEGRLLELLKRKPKGLEVILTGHEVSQEIFDMADYVTEMRKIKHPYDKGITARRGIEY